MNLFRGYIPSSGKAPLYSVKTYEYLKEPPDKGDYVGVLKEDIIQVDIDEQKLADLVFKIVKDKRVKCDILKTSRGYHFYFKNTNVEKQSVHYFSACGVPCDYGLGSKLRAVPLRITKGEKLETIVNGESVERFQNTTTTREWLQTYDELDELPCWLEPISPKSLGIMETDTRNQSLFNYILRLQSKGFTHDDVIDTLNVINEYVFEVPLSSKEMDTITREEAFSDEFFYNEDGKFLHDIFGNYMLANSHILMIDGQCNIYTKNGLYTNDPLEFERAMLNKIPSLKEAQRKEVYKYIVLKCEQEGQFASPKYIGLKDFVLDIETFEEIEYSPRIIINNKIQYNYDETAECEIVDKTLNKVCCNDPQIRALLEEMIGYSLYRANSMQTCFILTGEGSNGKSTILNVIKRLLGKDNYTSLDLRELEDTFKPSELYNKLANLGDDISAKYLENSSVFKKCVTGESFMVQRKYGQPFELESYATQIFCANEMPAVSDKTDGFSRRLTLLPFRAKFTKHDADYDPFIEDKLLSQEGMEYILKLAIKGLKRVLENNHFTKSDIGESEKAEYLVSNNNVLDWLQDEPKIENESVNDVYLSYKVWCGINGCNPTKKINFGKEIKKLGYDNVPRRIDGKVVRIYTKE